MNNIVYIIILIAGLYSIYSLYREDKKSKQTIKDNAKEFATFLFNLAEKKDLVNRDKMLWVAETFIKSTHSKALEKNIPSYLIADWLQKVYDEAKSDIKK